MADRRPRGDDGLTLPDVLVGMMVMAVFMTMFTGSIVLLFGSSNHSQAVAHTTQQIDRAFLWLDRRVRYADYVSAPVQVPADGGNWYVELRDPSTVPATCYQLRVDQASGQLQRRSWTASGPASAWQPLASGVANGGAASGSDDQPFVLAPAEPPLRSAQLTVNLITTEGRGRDGASSHASITLAALNTNATTSSHGECTGMRP